MDEGERIDAARDRRDGCKAWCFISVLCVVSTAALVLFWRVYSTMLFAHSIALFVACLIYMFLFIGALFWSSFTLAHAFYQACAVPSPCGLWTHACGRTNAPACSC
jgi:uncharacterized membrane protein